MQNTGLFCRALLQKRPIFLSILLIVATPYDKFISDVSFDPFCVFAKRFVNSMLECVAVHALHCVVGQLTHTSRTQRFVGSVLKCAAVHALHCVAVRLTYMSHEGS